MKNKITYYKINEYIEGVYYEESNKSYPLHTHTSHAIIGYVLNGAIQITESNQVFVYHAGEQFQLMPNVLHALMPAEKDAFSMLCLCIKAESIEHVYKQIDDYSTQLKNKMLEAPENPFSIDEMAKSVCISPYHMIRKFKSSYGLTPHQFQMQSRIRKAQKLLESGKTITEVAYATGFCDQSHFDRCFRKIVGLIPSEYVQSVKKLY